MSGAESYPSKITLNLTDKPHNPNILRIAHDLYNNINEELEAVKQEPQPEDPAILDNARRTFIRLASIGITSMGIAIGSQIGADVYEGKAVTPIPQIEQSVVDQGTNRQDPQFRQVVVRRYHEVNAPVKNNANLARMGGLGVGVVGTVLFAGFFGWLDSFLNFPVKS